jgi:large subunit ribosomal protein L25
MQLEAQIREKFGKSVQTLRNKGLIPAELYGHGIKNVHVAVNAKEFIKILAQAGESTLIEIAVDGKKHKALIHDVQRDYISDEVIHVDFHEVELNKKLKAHVELEFVGEPPALKLGGILNRSMSEVEVEALPGDLPHTLSVDLTKLVELNQSIYVKDIVVPKGVEITVAEDTVVATVTPPLKEEEIAPPVVDVSAVKVETEEKKAEREKVKAEAETK